MRFRSPNNHDKSHNPWGASGAITWTTHEPNPWGNSNWAVFPEPPSNHTTTSNSVQERPMPQPQPSLTKNVASYEPFFARRKERNEHLWKSECAKDRQRRENRERVPPTNKALMFEWVKGNNNLYTHVRVTKSQYEDCFDQHGKHQRRYNGFANEWDMCEDFGPLDKCQITENVEEDEESDVRWVTAMHNQAMASQTMLPRSHIMDSLSQTMVQTPCLVPDPNPPIPDSSDSQGSTVGETEGPLPRANEAAPLSPIETLPTTSVEPQVDPLVPFPGDVCHQDPSDVSLNLDEGLLLTPE